MSFLAPLFLLGGAAIAAPILFHLIRRTSKEKQPFSSLMFLQPSPPRVTKRSRLENLLLLLLRCAVLALLALGFARPFIPKPVEVSNDPNAGRKIVVMVDASASMKREGIWGQARERVGDVLAGVGRADRVALYVFDRTVRRLVSFEQWSQRSEGQRISLAEEQLAGVSPSWAGTRLGNALISAVEALEEADSEDSAAQWGGAREIVLVSDLQDGADLDAIQAYEWPEGVGLRVEPIKAAKSTNAGLQLVAERSDGPRSQEGQGPRVRISNAADSQREQFQVGWVSGDSSDFLGSAADAYVPPGQSRVVQLPKAPSGVKDARIRLTGDDETFDNTVWRVEPKAQTVPVFYLGSESETDLEQPLFYLKRAFQESKLEKIEVVARPAETPVAEVDLERSRLVVAARALVGGEAATLKAFAQRGGTVLVLLKSADDAAVIGALTGGAFPKTEEAKVSQYAMLGEIDFEHPLFAPFADPRFSDFTKIRFWKRRKLDFEALADARVIARFDDDDPAVTEISLGQGMLLVLSAGWHPADSVLARSSKFVPLMYALLENSGAIRAQVSQVSVGDEIAIDAGPGGKPVRIVKPDGATVEVGAGVKFADTDQPGVYTTMVGEATRQFAVNLAPGESRTAAIDVEDLPVRGASVSAPELTPEQSEARKRLLLKSQLESQQKLWRWLVIAALLALIAESFVAGRLTRPAAG